MYFGHVGDSRIYLLPARTGTIKQLTHDDTHVGWLRRNGQITEYAARNHPRRNVLQKSLGGRNQFVDPQVGAVGLEAGDTFLLCSDGLIDGLFDQRLVELLQSRNGKATPPFDGISRELIQAALEGGSRDNTTALVVRVA
jgi:protein phosphatase